MSGVLQICGAVLKSRKRIRIDDRLTELTRIFRCGIDRKDKVFVTHVTDAVYVFQVDVILVIRERLQDLFVFRGVLVLGADTAEYIPVKHCRRGV